MNINAILKEKKMTKYKLAQKSGLSNTTIIDICSGKTSVRKCPGETLFKLAKALETTIDDLLADSMIERPPFGIFRSNVCHSVKHMGDLDFILHVLEHDLIRNYHKRQWHPESLYLLAMIDYLCRVNDLPAAIEYDDLRVVRFHEPIYSSSIIAMSLAGATDAPKIESVNNAIPEFLRHNIVEGEVRNVV